MTSTERRAADSRRLPTYEAGAIEVPFVIRGQYEVLTRATRWEEHSHPTHELLWNERGASTATIGRRIWTITPSVGLWIPAGERHAGWAPAGTWHRAAQFSLDTPPLAEGPVAVDVTVLLRLLLDRLVDEELQAPSRATTESMVLDLMAPSHHELLLHIPEDPLLAPIVAAVQTDPADQTTLAGWAAQLAVSSRTLTRGFVSATGLGFSRWVATARCQHAMTLLGRGVDIEDVAELVGYRSASAFTTAFRRVTGVTPGRFRQG